MYQIRVLTRVTMHMPDGVHYIAKTCTSNAYIRAGEDFYRCCVALEGVAQEGKTPWKCPKVHQKSYIDTKCPVVQVETYCIFNVGKHDGKRVPLGARPALPGNPENSDKPEWGVNSSNR